ncbi:B12-binding domain-containing radical SAM protein [Spirillospora sp. CA-294931]|uniref:B12-binding domain-containing radical SAM protein n=1 Tax=Spirillospora sp. CA-294931 TaxID=3240042 RepID=UPI003D8DA30F
MSTPPRHDPPTPTPANLQKLAVIAGADLTRPLDCLFVNAPLRDYGARPRVNDFTLPVLGMAYIATAARAAGFNVGVLDAEAAGLPVADVIAMMNQVAPRWAGFNLLAPTYEVAARIAAGLDPAIRVMLGGHHAKAMPAPILTDPRMRRAQALVAGEAETRVIELLHDHHARERLPGVMWLDADGNLARGRGGEPAHLAPDLDALPVVDRRFLAQDPRRADDGRIEANMVAARGCPYDCSFCGAAVSANPDITIRVRDPYKLLEEMTDLHHQRQVTAFRFVDDLFLGTRRVITTMMEAFARARVADWAVWDATGRINVLHRASDETLDQLVDNGLREVALGIESGSERLLRYVDKRITPDMVRSVVRRLTERDIAVKGYFILGFPTETRAELAETVTLVHDLWDLTSPLPGRFRASVFEFRPYPGTPEWDRLIATGRYTPSQLLNYAAIDLTNDGGQEAMRARDEFNFSVGIQFGDAPLDEIRAALVELSTLQHDLLEQDA